MAAAVWGEAIVSDKPVLVGDGLTGRVATGGH